MIVTAGDNESGVIHQRGEATAARGNNTNPNHRMEPAREELRGEVVNEDAERKRLKFKVH